MAFYEKMIEAIKKEIIVRSKNCNDEIETIYYGGGTPSLLKIKDINDIFESIENNYRLSKNPEVTIEANPDDLNKQKLCSDGYTCAELPEDGKGRKRRKGRKKGKGRAGMK